MSFFKVLFIKSILRNLKESKGNIINNKRTNKKKRANKGNLAIIYKTIINNFKLKFYILKKIKRVNLILKKEGDFINIFNSY